eukprot:TRINITY_DN5332_c0_g1_i1.p1 TRINITY_DN5332_c0_g1~~TRINITY_DN5332_c0_g1_i1.p1  ORF type:complete len:793 (+),score=219.99 TRINITY_DN5332_c0_g1_i1:55-2433(+)
MARVIKGGVWKNVEDEILKAAVMKYGKNQWARIASLLARKSAKQCKARWFEYLDPSIKKTEWSREEEEKLLHLAKIMPCQWRTIAPIVGRTSSQCLEHYEKLLDAATEGSMYDPKDDPRKLRPGEIDPNPESKPPRQDNVDLEEDEKEMLQEARARLANTKGKKAKRKAREKQLEEGRRLAALQKRRELKAAGIQSMPTRPLSRKKKANFKDYNKEIPFQRAPSVGFYSTASEKAKEWKETQNPQFTPVLLQKLEGQRRDEQEDQRRKIDIKKMKERMDKDLPTVLSQRKQKLPDYVRRRAKLVLPEAQISDKEINLLSNMGYSVDDEGSDATKMLVSDYLPTPTPGRDTLQTPTPMRAERTPLRPDNIRMEAQNLRALQESSTPLLPGENVELNPTNFSGAAPKNVDIRTPNPLLTPLRGANGETPVPGATPSRTPMRDSLSINSEMEAVSQRVERMQIEEQKGNLKSKFASLPAPSREIKIAMPDVPEGLEEFVSDVEGGSSTFLADADDIDRKAILAAQQRKEKKLNMKSNVMNKGLPRPFKVSQTYAKSEQGVKAMELDNQYTDLNIAAEMIKMEMVKVITNDAISYPTSKARPPKINKNTWQYEYYSDSDMRSAKLLIDKEISKLEALYGEVDLEEYKQTWDKCNEDLIYIPEKNSFNLNSVSMSVNDRLDSMEYQYDKITQEINLKKRQIGKLEKKIAITQGGYVRKLATLEKSIEDLTEEINKKEIELVCFSALEECENRAIPSRLATSVSELDRARETERAYQLQYAEFSHQKSQILQKQQQQA